MGGVDCRDRSLEEEKASRFQEFADSSTHSRTLLVVAIKMVTCMWTVMMIVMLMRMTVLMMMIKMMVMVMMMRW